MDRARRSNAPRRHHYRARLRAGRAARWRVSPRAAGASARRRCGAEPAARVFRELMSSGAHAAALAQARARDGADPLRSLRERFALPVDERGVPLVYLCGHSLGLQPLAARELVNEELDEWAQRAVEGHEQARRPWVPYHENLRSGLGTLTGAHLSEVVAMNSLTVNLHLMFASFYRPAGERRRVLIEAGAFSPDRHAVASQIAWHGLDPHDNLLELAPA